MFQYLPSIKPGVVMIIPTAAPKNWLAPKRLAAEIPTKTGMKINGAADITWIIEDKPLIAG